MERYKDNYLLTEDGAHLYVESWGSGDTTVFLVPGFASSARIFKNNIPELAKRYKVVSFDPRGYGRSSVPMQGNNLTGHAKDIKEIVDCLDLKNVVLIGWSCGGGAVATYSRLFDDYRLKAIGLLDTHLFMMSPESWNTHPNRNYNTYNFKKNYWDWIKSSEGRFANTAFASKTAKGEYPQVGLNEEDQREYLEDGEVLYPWAGIELQLDYNITDNISGLKNITVPVILYESPLYGPALFDVYQKEIKTYCERHTFDSGHFLFYRESEKFNEATIKFIERI